MNTLMGSVPGRITKSILWAYFQKLLSLRGALYVDPKGLEAFVACRLIALDKRPGVGSIGNLTRHHWKSSVNYSQS